VGDPSEVAEAIVRRYFVCLDTEDWDTMRTLWHDDANLSAVGTRPRAGADAIVEYFSRIFAPWKQHTDAPTRFITSGDTIVVEVTFSGTTRDGRRVSFDAVDVFDVRDGLIARLSNWYDISFARRVLSDGGDSTPAAQTAS
jgi:ketosteroid isomerase-like protein